MSNGDSPAAPAPSGGETAMASIDMLLDISLPVVIEIGRTSLTMQEVLQLGPGSVVALERMVGEPVDVFVGDRRFAQGEVVVVGDHFGVRIARLLSGPDSEAPGC